MVSFIKELWDEFSYNLHREGFFRFIVFPYICYVIIAYFIIVFLRYGSSFLESASVLIKSLGNF